MRRLGPGEATRVDAPTAATGAPPAVEKRARRGRRSVDAALLVVLPWLPLLSGEGAFRVVGSIAFVLTAGMLLLCLRDHRLSAETRVPALGFLVLLPIGAVFSSALDFQAARQVLQLLLIALALRLAPSLRFGALARQMTTGLCLLLCAVALVLNLYGGVEIYANPNGYGVASVCWAAVLLRFNVAPYRSWRVLRAVVWLLLPALLALASESRSSLAAVGLMAVWIGVFVLIKASWLRVTVTLSTFVLSIVAILILAAGSTFDSPDIIPTVGDKSGLSGRNIIWASVLAAIDANGFRGFGLGSLPGGLLENHYEGLSAHNGFLQILYQFGAVGLLVLLGICIALLIAMARRQDGGVSAGILLAALVHELFEVVITQNHFGAGLLLWIIIAVQTPVRSLGMRPIRAWRGPAMDATERRSKSRVRCTVRARA
ncbi:MAG: O-antigen ligase family protein [Proteobacteria bacterium]|nr:O-antigen ligase family protein [Pseudomonadota bacterium]